jgi:hypothetical protein
MILKTKLEKLNMATSGLVKISQWQLKMLTNTHVQNECFADVQAGGTDCTGSMTIRI